MQSIIFPLAKVDHSGVTDCLRMQTCRTTGRVDQALNLNLNLKDYVEVPRSLVLYDVGGLR